MPSEDITKGLAKCNEVLADPASLAIKEAFEALKKAYEVMLEDELKGKVE